MTFHHDAYEETTTAPNIRDPFFQSFMLFNFMVKKFVPFSVPVAL